MKTQEYFQAFNTKSINMHFFSCIISLPPEVGGLVADLVAECVFSAPIFEDAGSDNCSGFPSSLHNNNVNLNRGIYWCG